MVWSVEGIYMSRAASLTSDGGAEQLPQSEISAKVGTRSDRKEVVGDERG